MTDGVCTTKAFLAETRSVCCGMGDCSVVHETRMLRAGGITHGLFADLDRYQFICQAPCACTRRKQKRTHPFSAPPVHCLYVALAATLLSTLRICSAEHGGAA